MTFCPHLFKLRVQMSEIHQRHSWMSTESTLYHILWFKCLFCMWIRAVRLIEIEIKSRFEIARFLNRFIARFFFLRPCPNLPQYAIRTNQNAAEQNRPGIQTDSMLKKQGRWVQNRIRTWWPKKCMLHAEHTAGSSDHISFRAESLSEDPALLTLSTKCPFGNLLIPESVE